MNKQKLFNTTRATLLVLLMFGTTNCGSTHTAQITAEDGKYEVIIVDPLTNYCRSLHPEVLYPDEFERQTLIVQCMKICSTSNACNIELPTNFPTQQLIN